MTFWYGKRVFVTGGTGLVGGWLIQELYDQKADIVSLVRDWVPHTKLLSSKLLNKVTTIRGDLSSTQFLERILAEYEIEIVIHLAAQTIVPIANKNPLSTFESNIKGTWNLLEACRSVSSIKSIVAASSDKAYGDAKKLPYKESFSLKAIYPYDVSKACADMLCQSYASSFNLPIAITRCGNFFGGGDLNWNRIIPGTIRSIIQNSRPIIRSDGTLIRDYIYVEDAVSAYLTLAKKLFKDKNLKGESFNFSNESQKSVLQITNLIIKLMDVNLKPKVLGNNNGEIKVQYLDSTKAKKLLKWKVRFGLEEGIKKTIDWYKGFFKNV